MKKITLIGLYFIFMSFFLFSQVPPIPPGDVNEDNNVNIVDALLVAQYYVGLNPEGLVNVSVSDVNMDGTTNIVDALLIAQFYVGLITEFPGGGTPGPTQTPGEDFVLDYIESMSLYTPETREYIISSVENSMVEIFFYGGETEVTNTYNIDDFQIERLRDAITGIGSYSYNNHAYWDCLFQTYTINFSTYTYDINLRRCGSPPDLALPDSWMDPDILNFIHVLDIVIYEVTQ